MDYFKYVMELPGVERGSFKLVSGDDWKQAEQLRLNELKEKIARAESGEMAAATRESEAGAIREQAKSELGEVQRALRELEALRAKAEEEANRIKRQAQQDRLAAASERADAERQSHEQHASQLDEVARMRTAAKAEFDAAERHRLELEDALACAAEARQRGAEDAAAAIQSLRQAEVKHAAAVAEQKKLEDAQREFAKSREVHEKQLALLARATDEEAGLDLRLAGEVFTMKRTPMSEAERESYAKPWLKALISMARRLAVALDRVRDFARRLVERERKVEDREFAAASGAAQLKKDRADLEAKRATHEAAVRNFESSRLKLEADQESAARTAAEAAKALENAKREKVSAKAASTIQYLWTVAMEDLEGVAEDVEITKEGKIGLNPRVAKDFPPEVEKFFTENQPPEWAKTFVTQRHQLAKALKDAEANQTKVSSAAKQLSEIVAKAGAALTPEQQSMKSQAAQALRQFGAGARNQGW